MSDRMAVMMDGNILQLGTPDEIYNNPMDIRVAEFVGAPKINLLPGHLDSNGHARCGDDRS
jgi:multiple sugar transport system ATP-binding protein